MDSNMTLIVQLTTIALSSIVTYIVCALEGVKGTTGSKVPVLNAAIGTAWRTATNQQKTRNVSKQILMCS